jgi:CDP-diacylglycerol--glycerol-3-phosphate 3-phosphatidyltransferase/cardiolipin synthase
LFRVSIKAIAGRIEEGNGLMLGAAMRRFLMFPNLLSALRLPLALALVLSFEHPMRYLFLGLAALTDFLDGQVARYTKSTSTLGAVLDPVFDRLFVLIVFLWSYVRFELPSVYLFAFFLRDIATVGTTFSLTCFGLMGRIKVQSRWSGKVVTFLQFLVLLLLVAGRLQDLPPAMSLLFLSSLWSMWDYFRSMRNQFHSPST